LKELIEKIKDALLAAESIRVISDDDIYVTPDFDVIPTNPTFPLIAIKDGDIEREQVAHNAEDWTMFVEIGIYQELKADDDSLLATAPTTYSLLELAADIRAILDYNLLNINGMLSNFSAEETGSELVGAEEFALQRKIITYEYLKRVHL
jgi:hypothetical protein